MDHQERKGGPGKRKVLNETKEEENDVYICSGFNNSKVLQNDCELYIRCCYTNSDSLLNKRSELTTLIALYITEVLPKHTATKAQESEFALDGYDICSNIENGHRGVMIYTAKYLNASPTDISPILFLPDIVVSKETRRADDNKVGRHKETP